MADRYGGAEFGIPHLMRAFHHNWRYEGTDIEVLTAYATQSPLYLVEAALIDAVRLTDSAVPTWAIEALWSAATDRCHDLRREGRDGRDWLRLAIRLCRDRLIEEVPGYQTTTRPGEYAHLTGVVLDEITLVSAGLLYSAVRAGGRYVPGIVPALNFVAIEACPDLAFRLLLRELTAYGQEVSRAQFERYVALGEMFEYGELLVAGYDHLVGKSDLGSAS